MSLATRVRAVCHQNDSVKDYLRKMKASVVAALYTISPVLLAECRYRIRRGAWPNLKAPTTFDEKLLWLMLYWRHPLKTQCGDKYAMRSYVEVQGLGHVLPELLGVFENSKEIPFDTLPERFVLKCTHGCGFNIICKNKRELNFEQTKRKLDRWMNMDFGKVYGEVHYTAMSPLIICEPYLGDGAADIPNDYKVYGFGGKAHCTMACTGRREDGHSALFDIYNRDWTEKLPYSKSSLLANRSIPKPDAYEDMLVAAEQLSRPFPFVRMDFYSVNGKAVLGEMTFTPCGCIDDGYTDIGQRRMGALIQLPDKCLEST